MAPRRTLSYATAFQWMCVKRLQELFDRLLIPHVASPMLFGETTVFGRYTEGVELPGQVDCLPEEVCHWRHPLSWPRLMEWMNEEVEKRECKSVIVKPRVEWALPDVLMMNRMPISDDEVDTDSVEPSAKRQKMEMATLTIGLLARKAVDKAEMMERCRHFHELFVSLDAKTRREFGRMTNVLTVCATAYSDDLPSFRSSDDGFVSMDVPPECGNVSEVLLLNLTKEKKRAEFFGWEKDEILMDAVETIVTNL
ncbi:hypothetical protein Poli38472_014367 [Pythium oligandrum]|uniref:Uncharacterized protein n=1 Tax=Pythium oligandrum TaxID=41045 RepID=A0A8K1FEA7_PYTOL|nr:hypothetical protein Poli38472_014367 [Pythium oligandrum]|eukprot:TMW57764.1 hypothetical protein Poli38472_014367 [Pythium oligandrum]